jgi:hypothetical protein
VPYQLHCDVVAQAELATELELTTELFDELEGATELELGTALFDELELGTELGTELFELDETTTELLVLLVVEHTAPVIVGFSAAAVLFLSPCTPKLTDWPG